MTIGLIAVTDPVRSSAAEAVRALHATGLKTVLLTGDNRRAAAAVAAELGAAMAFSSVSVVANALLLRRWRPQTPGSGRMSMTIGEVSAKSGVPAKTIRYYEETGLIGAAERRSNRYRNYSEGDVALLRFVGRARRLGFSLAAVKSLVALYRDRSRTSREVKAIAQHLALSNARSASFNRCATRSPIWSISAAATTTPTAQSSTN
ncbi:MAG TPA: MerR family transcriptional regulator [Stellaceae bacterium]